MDYSAPPKGSPTAAQLYDDAALAFAEDAEGESGKSGKSDSTMCTANTLNFFDDHASGSVSVDNGISEMSDSNEKQPPAASYVR